MVVHPGHGNYTGTLVMAYHFDNSMNSSERPGLVHRIDKDTGLLVIAKTEVAMSHRETI
jgi:23S rRNA pseudouridine1911/1915/1917 synthase